MHLPSSVFLLSLLHLSTSSVIRRQDPDLQPHPDVAPAPGSFSNGAAAIGEPVEVSDPLPAIYGPRSIDLPFNRLYHGHMKLFRPGQLNTPNGDTDVWGSANDNANQSACGIPDNAFIWSKVAIHPYFLKYAGLDRYCMQDVCISFWKPDGSSDMMLKVTDICSTDPSDPSRCESPSDIKVDRGKAAFMEHFGSKLQGDSYPEEVWWFFTKCWADGLPQPAYQGPNNWFANPPLPNNQKHASAAATQQYKNNQAAYAAKGWPTYPDGSYTLARNDQISPPISDWVPGQEPAWSPIAGGRGFSGQSSSNPSPPSNPSQPNSPANPAPPPSSPSPPPSPNPSSSPYSNTTSSTSTNAAYSSTSSTSTSTTAPNNGYTGQISTSTSASASSSASSSAPADAQQTNGSTGPDTGKQAPPPVTDPGTTAPADDGECEA